MSNWTYEKIYESGGTDDPGLVRVGDLVLYSGGYVEAGGVMFAPDVEIDCVCGAIHLKRTAGSHRLMAVAGSEVHVFEFRTVRLWCTRWYRYKPVSVSPSGDIDVSGLPNLPLGIRAKEACVTVIVAAVILYFVYCFILSAVGGSP